MGHKRVRAEDNRVEAGQGGGRAAKKVRFAVRGGDCCLEIQRIKDARDEGKRNLPDMAGAANTTDRAITLDEPIGRRRGVDAPALDERGDKEKEDDDMVIEELGESSRDGRSAQETIKGWMKENGLWPR